MKNHIAFKFVAVVLCAASLLAAIGSGLGVFVMTEMGLYEKTVAEVYRERVSSEAVSYAQAVAARYASANLGGCPDAYIDECYRYVGNPGAFTQGYFGYTLKDADGNVLEERALAGDFSDYATYEFPVSGEYMHAVSVTPESEMYRLEETEYTVLEGETAVYDAVPAIPGERVSVSGITVTYEDGSSESVGSDEDIGYLYHTENGDVVFQSFQPGILDVADGTLVLHVTFREVNGDILYEAVAPEPVGVFFCDAGGAVAFVSQVLSGESEITGATEAAVTDPIEGGSPAIRGVVSENVVTIRRESSLESAISGYLSAGDAVEILRKETVDGAEWGYVSEEAGQGWVFLEYLTLYAAAEEDVPETTEEVSGTILGVLEEPLNIYSAPDPNSEVKGRLDGGVTVELLEILFGETENGTDWGRMDLGWIMLDRVAVFAAQEETVPETDPNDGIAVLSETVPQEAADVTEPTAAEPIPEATVAAETTQTASTEAPAMPETAEETTAPEVPAATEAPEVPEETTAPEAAAFAGEPAETSDVIFTDDRVHTYGYYDYEAHETMYLDYRFAQMPEYTVELTLAPGALRYDSAYKVLEVIWQYRNDLFAILGVSVLLFAVLAVYLCCAAGRKPGSDKVRAAGLNCIPLDGYLVGGFIGIACLYMMIVEGGDYLLRQSLLVGCVFVVGMAYLACLLFVGFCFAFAAQVKTPDGYWCSNTLLCRCLSGIIAVGKWFVRFCVRVKEIAVPLGKRFFRWLWRVTVALVLLGKRIVLALYVLVKKIWHWFWALVRKWAGKLWDAVNRFLSLLPLTWQWLLAGFAIFLLLALVFATNGEELLVVLCLAAAVATILYGAHSFGTLWESTKAMSKGDLDTKVEDKHLLGCFKDFAGDLNDLADVAVVAAQKQLKSERMKTELITNVSHDIKTPLTSIINYVDLLQKPHTEAQQKQYLEVLDRQSQRLKKLIDDLMEMSKASTGNLTVDITRLDAVESVNQALGEFADKLDKAQLTPVFRRPEEPISMMADGRLVWRVLSNLLSNAVKYALPGTRLYIDLMELEGKVIISLKNISRDELNLDADELMERFVRGDDSRNTEGSGLGLNIAKSLMELQKGQLQLLVDGDLFKVTLIFPGA